MAKSRSNSQSGFSLVEVLIAIAIFVVGLVAVAQMFTVATSSNRRARVTTSSMVLAQQKMEQLRSLMWGFDELGLPLSDTTTDISKVPAVAGGPGLSPGGSLVDNTPGYVDYLDQNGRWVGTGTAPVAGTVFVRRWSIEPLPTNPNNTLILQVLVTRSNTRSAAANTGSVARLPEEARLVAVKTRKTI